MPMSPTKMVWYDMIRRCYNPDRDNYPDYGGRGIGVCDRWTDPEDGFNNFVEDMGERPDGLTLDREDFDGDYTPENCRWVTWEVQQNNNRASRFITYNGVKQTHAQWSRQLGGGVSLVRKRIAAGWDEKRAVTTPVRG